jgi:hypothetical protein
MYESYPITRKANPEMNKMLYRMLMALGVIAAQILFSTMADKQDNRGPYER